VSSFKCPNCGAPISPKFGEMVITCEYCGSGVTLGMNGWKSIQKQTMLPLKIQTQDETKSLIRSLMDRGLLHRHLQESSTLEEIALSYVPYWIISASARTSIVAVDEAAQVGQVATEAALMGIILGGMSGGGGFGRRRFLDLGISGLVGKGLGPRNVMMFGMGGMMMGGGGGGARRTYQMDENYNYPVIALKAFTQYQPQDYQFALDQRAFFDITKIPKGVKVLNGDVGEDAARSQGKTLVDQLQSQKAHDKYHMIQKIDTEVDVTESELLHAPVWFARYDHKGNKIIVVIDANSGGTINTVGL
jgi:hypothetical protein